MGGSLSTHLLVKVYLPFSMYIYLFLSLIFSIGVLCFNKEESSINNFSKHTFMWSIIKICLMACGSDSQFHMFMLLFIMTLAERVQVNLQITPKSSIVIALLFFYLAEHTSFSKNSYSDIPFNKAYLGFPEFNLYITAPLVLLNIFGGHLAVLWWIFSWSFSCKDLEEEKELKRNRKQSEIFELYTYFLIFHLLSTISSFIMVQHGKLHLHFTELYAPSFILRTAKWLFLFISTIFVSIFV